MILIFLSGSLGAEAGFKWFGLLGGAIGAVIGGGSGHFLGCLMSLAMNRLTERCYRRKSTASLRADLGDASTASTYISTLIISILLKRGEAVESLRDYVFRQLNSGDVCQRKAGIANLGLCYPDLAAQLKGFNPFQPTKDDLQHLKDIEWQARLTGRRIGDILGP